MSAALYLADPRRWLLFSGGFGSRLGDYNELARQLRERGWSVALLVHRGSDRRAALRLVPRRFTLPGEQLRLLAHTPANRYQRPLHFLTVAEAIRERFAPRTLVAAGHSFGAFTAMAASGVPVLFESGRRRRVGGSNFAFDALVVISPQKVGDLCHRDDYRAVTVPGLYVTGTRDRTPDGADFGARMAAIARVPESLREVVVFDPAAHMDFAGLGRLDLSHQLADCVDRFLSAL